MTIAVPLLIALGVAAVVSALRPTLPVLRAAYWWRVGTDTRPGPVERGWFGVVGIATISLGGYLAWLQIGK